MENQNENSETMIKKYPDALAVRARLQLLKREIEELIKMFSEQNQTPTFTTIPFVPAQGEELSFSELSRTLEGIFNGEKMIGTDNQEYHIPPNYASKSKLVPGDRMKLTITPTGSFIYKQIGPVERQRVIGTLDFNPEHNRWLVKAENAEYRVLTASISFYKGKIGDGVIILIPQTGVSEWAAVDHLIAK